MKTLHKTLNLDEYTIHYFILGEDKKECIVLLHPAFSDHRAFNLQIEHFSRFFKVVCLDLIGHGLSKTNGSKDKINCSAEHIYRILGREKIKEAHILGVSMGSLVAQHFALQYPGMTKSLIALGGYSIHESNNKIARAQLKSHLNLLFWAMISMTRFRKKTALITAYSKVGQELFYQSASLYGRRSFMVMAGFSQIIKDRPDYHPEFRILILTGEYDIPLAHEMAERWNNTNSNAKYEVIKNAGHCANMDQAKTFNELVKDFILFPERPESKYIS